MQVRDVKREGRSKRSFMIVNFERATAADAETLVSIQIAAFHSDSAAYPGVEVGGPPGYDSVENMHKKIQEEDCYKIVVEGRIIGGMVVFDYGQRHLHLDVIYIDPAYHNRGIGTQALHFLEQTYPAKRWTLHSPLYAIRNQHFYEKFGYVKMAEEVHDIILIAYEKRL
jgi:ribosomal protein S18 acetylase RimI-like enzyme